MKKVDLLAGLQICHQGRIGWVALPLLEGKGEPFLAAADGQQLEVRTGGGNQGKVYLSAMVVSVAGVAQLLQSRPNGQEGGQQGGHRGSAHRQAAQLL